MALTKPQHTLNLLGPFRLLAPDGARIEVASRKGVALIAMLAMAKEGERTRPWLQEKLWGSREPLQAQASLRRELSNLRKSLNTNDESLLICERDRVRLNLAHVSVDARQIDHSDTGPDSGDALTGEFLEGIDVTGENEFEDWLREQRRRLTERLDAKRHASAERRGDVSGVAFALPDRIVDISGPPPGFGGRPALAVLSFRNLTGDEGNDYLSEGISEELIERVSRLRWLPVIGRSSSFSVAVEKLDQRVIGRALGAKYLFDGRLRLQNGVFVLSTVLSEAETGYTIWSTRVSLPSPHAPNAMEQLVVDLVAVLSARIDHAEQMNAHAKPRDCLEAGELIWRGRWHLNRFTREDSEAARALFDEALKIDPNSPEALIQATWCLCWSLWAQRGSEQQIVEMRKLAQRAIIADCDDSRGHMLAGIAETWLRQPARAKALLERAIELNPSLALAHAQLGDCLWLAGEPENAIAPLKMALRLSPNDMHLFFTLGELAISYCMLGRWDEAIDHANQSLVRRPAYWFAHMVKINTLLRKGDIAAAEEAYRTLMTAKPSFALGFIDWVPFVDRSWNDYFLSGTAVAAGHLPTLAKGVINRVSN